MRTVYLLRRSAIHMDPMQNGEFSERLMEAKLGTKCFTKMKIQALNRLVLTHPIRIPSMLIYGPADRGPGKMAHGMVPIAGSLNLWMAVIPGNNLPQDFPQPNRDSAELVLP